MCDSASAYIVAFVPYYERFTTDGLVRLIYHSPAELY